MQKIKLKGSEIRDKSEITALDNTSPESVVEAFRTLKSNFRKNKFLNKTNRYFQNTVIKTDHDTKIVPNSINLDHISQYIAASTILHCQDGWSYLGGSLKMIWNRDSYTARHLAYYAELRAGMSILACMGVGVFNNRHIVLTDTSLNVLPFLHKKSENNQRRGTHEATWSYLNHLSSSNQFSNKLFNNIKAGGITANKWFDSLGISNYRNSIGKTLIQQCGLDIKLISQDHGTRNKISYRPSKLINSKYPLINDTFEIISDSWNLASEKNFNVLDRNLIRILLENANDLQTGQRDQFQFETRINNIVDGLAPYEMSNERWKSFLLRKQSDQNPSLLINAFKNDPIESAENTFQIFSRAYLLLRIASGFVSEIMKEANVDIEELKFWWESLAINSGFQSHSINYSELFDQFTSYIDADLYDLKNDYFEIRPSTPYEWINMSSKYMFNLSQLEKIGIWSLNS